MIKNNYFVTNGNSLEFGISGFEAGSLVLINSRVVKLQKVDKLVVSGFDVIKGNTVAVSTGHIINGGQTIKKYTDMELDVIFFLTYKETDIADFKMFILKEGEEEFKTMAERIILPRLKHRYSVNMLYEFLVNYPQLECSHCGRYTGFDQKSHGAYCAICESWICENDYEMRKLYRGDVFPYPVCKKCIKQSVNTRIRRRGVEVIV